MKLYYYIGGASLSTHIVLRELGLPFEMERVNLLTKRTAAGEDYLTIAPKGMVPALLLDDGNVLTESSAIIQHLADAHGALDLAPAPGTLGRARVTEFLSFVASDLQKSFAPLFNEAPEEAQVIAHKRVRFCFDYFDTLFSDGRTFLTGDLFTVADAHLYTIASWGDSIPEIGLSGWPNLVGFLDRVNTRPSVIEARAAEGPWEPDKAE